MAKKSDSTGGEGEAKDRHRANRLVRISPELHDLLSALAKKNSRPLTWELRLAIVEHLKRAGVEVPEEQ